MKRPSFQFYPGDWLNDASLRMCSVGARGLWIEMICIMHQGSDYGHLKVNGKVILPTNLARMTGSTLAEVEGWLEELEGAGVFSKDEAGGIFSRRMIRDEEIRQARAAGGVKGGNPALKRKKEGSSKVDCKVNLGANLQPTPSSSSSSSSSSFTTTATATDACDAGADLVDPSTDRIPPVNRGAGEPKILITAAWKPSEHFDAMATMAGIRMDDDTRRQRVAEFVSYWLPRSEIKTKSDWDHGLLQACIRWKNTNPPTPVPTKTRPQAKSALHTFDDVDYSYGVNPDGSF